MRAPACLTLHPEDCSPRPLCTRPSQTGALAGLPASPPGGRSHSRIEPGLWRPMHGEGAFPLCPRGSPCLLNWVYFVRSRNSWTMQGKVTERTDHSEEENDSREMAPQICRLEETSPSGSSSDAVMGKTHTWILGRKKEDRQRQARASASALIQLWESGTRAWRPKCVVLENDFSSPMSVIEGNRHSEIDSPFRSEKLK